MKEGDVLDKNNNELLIELKNSGLELCDNGVIRCAEAPEKCFSEAALRMLSAVRFAAQLRCSIESGTSAAIHSMCSELSSLSPELIRDELDMLVCGENAADVLLEYSDVILSVIPEFASSIGFDQHSPYHKYTVWEHILRAMSSAPEEDIVLRRALFFHDIGKPACATFDETGRGHFKGHDRVGADMTREIMRRLGYDSKSIDITVTLIANHSAKLRTRDDVKLMMNKIGSELFFVLMEMKKCDNLGKNDFVAEENIFFDELIAIGREIADDDILRSDSNA